MKHLINISTVEVVDDGVNAFSAGDVSEHLVQKMHGELVFSFSFKRKDKPLTMKSNSTWILSCFFNDLLLCINLKKFRQHLVTNSVQDPYPFLTKMDG